MNNSTEIHKGFEIFIDSSYYDMIAFRKCGCKDFEETKHVDTFEEAKQCIDEHIILNDYMDWYKNKYGGVVMISEYWINEFVNGK